MPTRITSRSRPVTREYPWPLRTRETNVAELVSAGTYGIGLIGPLPIEAVMELVYRVRELTFEGEVTFDEGDPATISPPAPARMEADEIEVWRATRYTGNQLPVTSPPWDEFNLAIDTANAEAMGQGGYEVFADENNRYWLSGKLGEGDGSGVAITTWPLAPPDSEIEIDLVLSSGTYPIIGYVTSTVPPLTAYMTITATEWHPYATKSGAPAWDVATGQPINGGPGA